MKYLITAKQIKKKFTHKKQRRSMPVYTWSMIAMMALSPWCSSLNATIYPYTILLCAQPVEHISTPFVLKADSPHKEDSAFPTPTTSELSYQQKPYVHFSNYFTRLYKPHILTQHASRASSVPFLSTEPLLPKIENPRFICYEPNFEHKKSAFIVRKPQHQETFELVNLLHHLEHLQIMYESDPEHPSVEDQIQYKYEAQVALARINIYAKNNPELALKELTDLLKTHPKDPRLYTEIGSVLLFQKKYDEAFDSLQKALLLDPNMYILSKLIVSFTELGYFAKAERLIEKLETESESYIPPSKFYKLFFKQSLTTEKDLIQSSQRNCAIAYFKMGYYQKSIKLAKELIEKHPDSVDYYLLLCDALTQAERFEEADAIYRILLYKFPGNPTILRSLITLRRLQNNYPDALKNLGQVLDTYKNDNDSDLFLQAALLYENREYEQALLVYEKLTLTPFQNKLLIEKGKTFLAMQKLEEAYAFFKEAYKKFPEDTESQFYYLFYYKQHKNYAEEIIQTYHSAHTLHDFSALFKTARDVSSAIMLLEAATRLDPSYVPAQLSLAELYGIKRSFKQSVDLATNLLERFPKNDRFLIQRARSYGYGAQYLNALEAYTTVIAFDPINPVPKIDRARTSFWSKDRNAGKQKYLDLLLPPIDQVIYDELGPNLAAKCGIQKKNNLEEIEEVTYQSRELIYMQYERLYQQFDQLSLTQEEQKYAREVLQKNWSGYRIQKAVYLELYAKLLFWNTRYLRASKAYRELITMQPGNREAIFDYSLVRCELSMCQDSLKTDEDLLHMDPVHPEATQARERELTNSHPSIGYIYRLWRERGFGDASAVKRWEHGVSVSVPLSCQHTFYATKTKMNEHSLLFNTTRFGSRIETVGFRGIFSPYISANLEGSQKTYEHRRFRSRHTGQASISWRTSDYLTVSAQYERANELYNYFGYKQALQARHARFSADSFLTRYLHLHLGTDRIFYSDHNKQRFSNCEISYQFLEEPFYCFIILNAEHRNTAKETREIAGTPPKNNQPLPAVVDMKHPYWTPQRYHAESIRLRFIRHFISPVYCGNLQRYFDCNIIYRRDNKRNPGYEFDGTFHFDFTNHCRVEVRGVRYSYRTWKAYGWWLSLNYYF